MVESELIERSVYLIASQQIDRTRTLRIVQIFADLLLQAIILFFDSDGTDENDCNVNCILL